MARSSLPLLCLLLATAVQARGVLEEMKVVGQQEAPFTVQPRGLAVSLGPAQFEAINAPNTEDLLKYAPSFSVRKRYIGDANAIPTFRGTHSAQSARALVMVDGFVISNYLGSSYTFPPKWGVVGPGEVEQFGVVYGPYSARYPGNSMGGIVAIATRPPTTNEAFVTVQGFVQPYEQYGTDDTYRGYTAEAGFGWKQQDGPLGLRASYRRLDNTGQPQQWVQLSPSTRMSGAPGTGAIRDGDLIVDAPIYGAFSPDQNIQDQLRLRADLDLGAWTAQGLLVYWSTASDTAHPESYLRDAAGSPIVSGPVEFEGRVWELAPLIFELAERDEALVGLRLQGPLAGWQASFNLSHFWIDKSRLRVSRGYQAGLDNGVGTLTEEEPAGWWTFASEAERVFGAHTLAIGLSANTYRTETRSYSTTAWRSTEGQVLANLTAGESRLLGAFIEDELALTETLSLTGGLRLEQWRATDGQVGSLAQGAFVNRRYADREERELNGALSLKWRFDPGWTVQLSLATATRFPTVGELFQGRLNSAGEFDLNSFDPQLRPEQSRDANLILQGQLGRARLTGSLFYQRVEDAIFRQQGFNRFGVITTAYQNIDEVAQLGAEGIVEFEELLPGLDVDFNLAYIDAEIVENRALPASEGNQFPRIPYWRANGQIRYELATDWRASAGFRYASRPNSDLDAAQRNDTFGYASEQFIVDARLSWQVTAETEISIGVDNLTNDKAWAFHPFPQRTWLVEMKWRKQ